MFLSIHHKHFVNLFVQFAEEFLEGFEDGFHLFFISRVEKFVKKITNHNTKI